MTPDPRYSDWLDVQEPDLSAALAELRELQREPRSYRVVVLALALASALLVVGGALWLLGRP
ncbi:MAG: hypothetical protein H0W36_00585 [Gemmatimonadetes bacterium]|nr:hypothetical protein [Gemmatimonadota bacterium]